ncbi:hypothetical protein Clacol_001891 [Clathrus columnatus]|uniref:Uncharacterized protein n=1 Tax=Clathrus columnatus TaxID=1419009 RepID=A0AAV5A508_9AGAM|nr:hypothetical protein Clacol_001891 [Clathrus columnatus]
MDDETSFADPLSYDDDVPYEEQIEPMTLKSDDLKQRIGSRIYLLEDALTKKRKRLTDDVQEVQEEQELDETIIEEDMAGRIYRPNALLLHGPAISQMPTNKVFAYATHFDAQPIGLEWVDDQTCILVFPTRKSALHAWDVLLRPSTSILTSEEQMQLDNMDQSLRVAHSLPLALYPADERISSALGTSKLELSKKPIQIRWAQKTDVKERGARNKSQFYKRFGETAGKPANRFPPGYQPDDTRRNGRDDKGIAQLDAELDQFLGEDDAVTDSLKGRIGGRKGLDPDEQRKRLDDELDRFLAGEEVEPDAEVDIEPRTGRNSDRTLSLLERTGRRRSASPRRKGFNRQPVRRQQPRDEHGRDRVKTDSNGRWLHNAEIADRRRRMDYDSSAYGMRAWGDDNDTSFKRPSKKFKKNVDDLDRELDEFGERDQL